MDEQKHLKNEQGEPGNKTEKSEYLFMQETIKDENSRGKKYRKKSRMKPLQIPAMTVQYRRLALTVTENFRKQ